MKIPINLFMCVSICLAVLLLSGMEGCNTEEEAPIAFVQAIPADEQHDPAKWDDCRDVRWFPDRTQRDGW